MIDGVIERWKIRVTSVQGVYIGMRVLKNKVKTAESGNGASTSDSHMLIPHIYIHSCPLTHSHPFIDTFTHTCSDVHNTLTHAFTHTFIYTFTHTFLYTHTHTHRHTLTLLRTQLINRCATLLPTYSLFDHRADC